MNYKVGVNFKEGKILKIILGFTIVLFEFLIACQNNNKRVESNNSSTVTPVKDTVIEMTPTSLLDSFFDQSRIYEMNTRYIGHKMRITGKVYNVTGDGNLELLDNLMYKGQWVCSIICYGINDHNFLTSIKKGDIVRITGTFDKTDGHSTYQHFKLQNCITQEKLSSF